MLRAEAEVRLREVRLENECCKARLAQLQEDFRKMEEMVRDMIQFKSRIDQLKHEKSSLALTYESKMRKYQTYIASLEKENFMLLNELKSAEVSQTERQEEQDRSLSRVLLERVRLLEQENATLSLENEQQRLQYEHCLDDVANQVVQALLAQKNLREECNKLQCRVQELEQQNRALSQIFKTHLMRPESGEKSLIACQSSCQTPDKTEAPLPLEIEEARLHQQLVKDSPTTCHSEDSSESLASMCSDYSLHSIGSGIYSSRAACPKLSSPPRWFPGQSILAGATVSSASILQSKIIEPCGMWAVLQRAELNTLKKSAVFGRENGSACQRFTSCLNAHPDLTWNSMEAGLGDSTVEEFKHSYLRERRSNRRRWSILRSSSELGDLDSMETPSDDAASLDNLPITKSANTPFLLGFPNPSDGRRDEGDVCENSIMAQYLSSNLIYPPSRPNTLNIVPHIMGDPANNFSYRSLETKSHVVNQSGNMYEELDLPPFPNDSPQSKQDALGCSQYSGESPNCDEQTVPLKNSCETTTRELNTVIRRNCTPNCIPVSNVGDRTPNNLPSPILPPPCDLEDSSAVLKELNNPPSESPVSAIVSEHGKDEGYSTMSSDMQVDVNSEQAQQPVYPSSANYAVTPVIVNRVETYHDPRIIQALTAAYLNHPLTGFAECGESIMASSSDSGLSLQRCSRSTTAQQTIEESLGGFECDLNNSLLRSNNRTGALREGCAVDGAESEMTQLDSGLGDSPLTHRMSSFSEPSDRGTCVEETEERLKSLHRSSLDPSYDKILTLLTPRGFKASDIGRQGNITAGNVGDARIETAEKATYTEPEGAYYPDGFASDGSLISNECRDHSRYAGNDANSCDGDCESSCSLVRLDDVKQSSTVASLPSTPNKTSFSWHNADLYSVSCRYCRMRKPKHSLVYTSRMEALGSMLRAFSDSHLLIKKVFEKPLTARADSLGTRCPPLRLNLLPLERHSSACDLSPVSGPVVSKVEAEPRSREPCINVNDIKSAIWNSRLSLEHQGSPSLSLSTVHSSSSEELASEGEDEDLGTTSLKCSKERDLSSDSENDLLENNSLVEQWLQQGSNQLPHKLQNGYTYDEEEVGNWSFQLSSEDISQSQIPPPREQTWEDWPQNRYDNASLQRLEMIQENVQENHHQGDFWNKSIWPKESSEEVTNSSHNFSNKGEWIAKPAEELVEVELERGGTTCEKVLNSNEKEKGVALSEGMGNDISCVNENILPANEEQSQTEITTEFNRDFYRLCSTDSTRSLACSNRSLLSECNCSSERAPSAHRKTKQSRTDNLKSSEKTSNHSEAPSKKEQYHSRERNLKNSQSYPDGEAFGICKNRAGDEKNTKLAKTRSERISGIPSMKNKPERTRIPVINAKNSTKSKEHGSQQQRHSRHHSLKEGEEKVRNERISSRVGSAMSGSKIIPPETSCIALQSSIAKLNRTSKSNSSGKRFSNRSSAQPETLQENVTHRKISGRSRESKHDNQKVESEQVLSVAEKIQQLNMLMPTISESESQAIELSNNEQSCSSGKVYRDSDRSESLELRRNKEGCCTSWVHFETDLDLSDPKARANLLDSMMASSSSSSSSSTDCEGEESAWAHVPEEPKEKVEEVIEYKHHERLHALHRFRRHKKRAADPDAVISFVPRLRSSIIDRHDFYYRFGEKEQEAVACFDFLNDLSTSPSDIEANEPNKQASLQMYSLVPKYVDNVRCFESDSRLPNSDDRSYLDALDIGLAAPHDSAVNNRLSLDETRLFSCNSSPQNSFSSTTLNSQDCDHISLSDSCAESYASSNHSLNRLT